MEDQIPTWEQFVQRHPDVPQDQLRAIYTHGELMQEARRNATSGDETVQGYLTRRSVPFGSALLGVVQGHEYANAMERVRNGTASRQDYQHVANYEATQQQDANRGTLGRIAGGVAMIPAIVGEAAAGGAAMRGLGLAPSAASAGATTAATEAAPLFSRAGATALAGEVGANIGRAFGTEGAGAAAAAWGRNALSTAAMPSLYAEAWAQRATQAGRDPLSFESVYRDLPPAYAVGFMQNAILGSLSRVGNSVPGTGVRPYLTRLAARTITGMGEQQAADVLGGLADNVLPEMWQTRTRYGILGSALRGEWGAAFEHATIQAATFAAFSALHPIMHGEPQAEYSRAVRENMRPFQNVVDKMAEAGLSKDSAARKLNDVFSRFQTALQARPEMTRTEAGQMVEQMKLTGPLADFARSLADSLPPTPYGPEVLAGGQQPSLSNMLGKLPEQQAQQPTEAPQQPPSEVDVATMRRMDAMRRQGLRQGQPLSDQPFAPRQEPRPQSEVPLAPDRAQEVVPKPQERPAAPPGPPQAQEATKPSPEAVPGRTGSGMADLWLRHLNDISQGGPGIREEINRTAGLSDREAKVLWARLPKEQGGEGKTLQQAAKDAGLRSRQRAEQIERDARARSHFEVSVAEFKKQAEGLSQEGAIPRQTENGVNQLAGVEGMQPRELDLSPAENLTSSVIRIMEEAKLSGKTFTPKETETIQNNYLGLLKEIENARNEGRGDPRFSPKSLEQALQHGLLVGQNEGANEASRNPNPNPSERRGEQTRGSTDTVGADSGGSSQESLEARPATATAAPGSPQPMTTTRTGHPSEPRSGLLDAVQTVFQPATRGENAEGMGGNLRENLAKSRRAQAVAGTALGKRDVVERLWHSAYEIATSKKYANKEVGDAHDLLESMTVGAKSPQERNANFLSFTDAVQGVNGARIEDLPKPLQLIAKAFRNLQNQYTSQLASRGLLNTFIDNYMSQLWQMGKTPEGDVAKMIARRPLGGTKYFLKKRSLMSYREGIEGWVDHETGQHVSLEPKSWNPVELMLLSFNQMQKAILEHDVLTAEKQAGRLKAVMNGQKAPEGWVKLSDGSIFAPPVIPMTEFFDVHQRAALEKLASNLGIDVNRVMKFGRAGKAFPKENRVEVAFGTGHDILAHEIGHIIDKRYGLATHWAKDVLGSTTAQELSDLAAMRHDRISVDPSYEKYVQQGSEKIANLVAAYIHAPEMARQIAPNSVKQLEALIKAKPELAGLAEAKPSLVLGSETQNRRLAGPQLTGHWYGPEESMTLINNHLNPSQWNTNIKDVIRDFGGAINNFQLGFSFFHAGFVALDTQASAAALGVQMMSRGDFLRGLKNIVLSPIAPFTTWLSGSKVTREYFFPGSQGAETARILDATIAGGMSVRMDRAFYGNDHLERFRDAINSIRRGESVFKKTGSALYHALPALAEFVSYPTMEVLVPRMKVGAMVEATRYWLEKNPGASVELQRKELGKIWDSMENRLGQVTYDNLFWNRTLKDTLMLGVRSVGWNLGTIREIGGGIKDIPGSVKGIFKGEGISPRTAYIIALPMITGFYGALYQLIATGKGPDELKDYFFPKTGRLRADGTPDRVSLPSYMRDVAALTNRADEGPYRVAQNVFSMAKHKVNPLLSIVAEMLSNEDFYGSAIVDPRDPHIKQSMDLASHLFASPMPFSFRSPRGSPRTTGQMIQQQFGITPAPGYVVHSSEQQRQIEEHQRSRATPLERLRRVRRLGQ